MTEYYVSRSVSGKTKAGVPYRLFWGIHHLPAALADTHEANDLGIKPVEEMTDDEWRALALDRDVWMAKNRPKPEPKAEDKPGDGLAKPQGKLVAAVSDTKAAIPAAGDAKPS